MGADDNGRLPVSAGEALGRRVTELRAQAFELLDEMSHAGLDRDLRLSGVVEDMLSAANRLGRIERALAEREPAMAKPVDEHAVGAASLRPSLDAAIVLALAGTSLPFASSIEDEAERWLRVLRLHGEVGAALQALGVSEAPLETSALRLDAQGEDRSQAATRVESVKRLSAELASRRGADCVATLDILFAVLSIYDRAFDRALYIRGTTREELLGRLRETTASTR